MSDTVKKDLLLGNVYSAVVVVAVAVLFYLSMLNHININEVGVAYNSFNGSVTLQTNAGWYVTSPLTKVINVSCWPTKVSLNTMSVNTIGTKIVRIRKDKVMDYINLQGLSYSWGSFDRMLSSYVFSGKTYSFIEVIEE